MNIMRSRMRSSMSDDAYMYDYSILTKKFVPGELWQELHVFVSIKHILSWSSQDCFTIRSAVSNIS